MTGLPFQVCRMPNSAGLPGSSAFSPFRSCSPTPSRQRHAARVLPRALPEGPMIKICGVTNAADAAHAARQGAGLIGMIMWPRAPRYVPLDRAREVAAAARALGSEPVGVFVSESAEEITRVARGVGLKIVQLHGPQCQAELGAIPLDLQVIYVLTVSPEGELLTKVPDPPPRPIDAFLVDSVKRTGPSLVLDWAALPPAGAAGVPWLLAGGLTADTVCDAICTARPHGVDVSSHVAGPDGLAKDQTKVTVFVSNALQGFAELLNDSADDAR